MGHSRAHVSVSPTSAGTQRATVCAVFRKSDNENTVRYTLVPEDIPIRKVYQKVCQLHSHGGGNPKLAVSDGARRSLLVDSPSDRSTSSCARRERTFRPRNRRLTEREELVCPLC